jgi:hypothetical protein
MRIGRLARRLGRQVCIEGLTMEALLAIFIPKGYAATHRHKEPCHCHRLTRPIPLMYSIPQIITETRPIRDKNVLEAQRHPKGGSYSILRTKSGGLAAGRYNMSLHYRPIISSSSIIEKPGYGGVQTLFGSRSISIFLSNACSFSS